MAVGGGKQRSLDLLLVFDSHKSEKNITFSNEEDLLHQIEKGFKVYQSDLRLQLISACEVSCDFTSDSTYNLQRYSPKWEVYVDVTDVLQICNGDKLTITLQKRKDINKVYTCI